jgi:hypothetical protein
MASELANSQHQRDKPQTTGDPAFGFNKFAEDIKSFQKTLYGLVASSFVISAISSIVNADAFKSDPGLPAITLLIGTVGGIAGVLVTYLGAAQHPTEAGIERRRFRTGPLVWRIGISFLISVAAFFLFFYVSHFDHIASLAALPFATYFFFRGLVTGFMAVHFKEAQEREWNSLTVQERLGWTAQLEQEEQNLKDMRKTAEDINEHMQEFHLAIRTARRATRKAKIDAIKRKIERIHLSSIRLRYRIAGDMLLLQSECNTREMEDFKITEQLREFLAPPHPRETYEKIKSGELLPVKLQDNGVEFYKVGRQYFFVIRERLDEATAQKFLDAFERYRDDETGKFKDFVALLDGQFDVMAEGLERLLAESIAIYRISNWQLIT